MEQDPEITLQKVTEEYQRLINVKRDNTRIEEEYLECTKDKITKSPKVKKKIINAKIAVIKIPQEVTVILKIRYISNAGGKATKFQYVEKKKKQQQ